jgi:hypothetical protein
MNHGGQPGRVGSRNSESVQAELMRLSDGDAISFRAHSRKHRQIGMRYSASEKLEIIWLGQDADCQMQTARICMESCAD